MKEQEAQIVKDGLQAYIIASGVLKNGTPEEIVAVKAEFRKMYKRVHRRQQRQVRPNITVVFKDIKTFEVVKSKAKATNRDVSAFLQESALAYAQQQFLNPQKEIYQEVLQLLTIQELHIRAILEVAEDEGKSAMHYYDLLLKELADLKKQLVLQLDEAKLMKDALRLYVKEQPWIKEELIHYIQNL